MNVRRISNRLSFSRIFGVITIVIKLSAKVMSVSALAWISGYSTLAENDPSNKITMAALI